MKKPLIMTFLFALTACTAVPPKNSDNICATFRENEEWYEDAKQSYEKWDAKNLYLAYHEGHGGYQRKSYLNKAWLKRVSDKVAYRARLFQRQLNACKMN